jgi:hypothetical protein
MIFTKGIFVINRQNFPAVEREKQIPRVGMIR